MLRGPAAAVMGGGGDVAGGTPSGAGDGPSGRHVGVAEWPADGDSL